METKGTTRREFFLKSIQASAFVLFYQNSVAGSFLKDFGSAEFVPGTTIHPFIASANDTVDMIQQFTDTYKRFPNNIYLREAHCIKVQWKAFMSTVGPDDLFVGVTKQAPIGFVPQSDELQLGYFMHPKALEILLNDLELTHNKKQQLESLMEFWAKNNTVELTKQAFDPEMKKILTQEKYWAEPGIAFILWRMSGIQMDYEKLVRLGIPGLREEISGFKRKVAKQSEEHLLYEAMLISLDTLSEVCLFYADKLKELQPSETSATRKAELRKMEAILRKLPDQKPGTLREAMQLVFIYTGIDGSRNYGRLDEALGTIYDNDLAANRCNEEEAVRLFTSFWNLIARRGYRYDSRIIIGGKGRINERAADKIALVMIETTRRVKDIVPQLALRFYTGQNPELYKKELDAIAEGNPYPMLYNDEVNIPSVMKAFDVPYEEAVHAIQYGCGEYVLNHRSVGTPSAVINMLQALIVTLFKGIDPLSGQVMGMPAERFDKYGNFETFDQLWCAYCEQVEYYVDQLSRHEELEYVMAGKCAPFLYSSMLMDDCIKSGKPIFSGGIRYLGGTLESYGNSNTADSFTAIKRLVYDEKKTTLGEIRDAIKADFSGYALLKKMMLDCPKYGNDNTEADDMLVKVHEHICNYTRDQKSRTNMHSYLIVVINNDANTVIGENTAASPDGRNSRQYMNPGNNPVGGADKNGVTAFLNSLVKPRTDIHAGAVQNMKFSKEMFSDYRDKLEILLLTYWQNGGAQAMLTVVGREDLQQAMIHPELYQNLIVRVGGFSERFVNLPRLTQEEILSRTLY